MKYRLIEASPADEAWLDDLRRRAYADVFHATWGGWDEDRHLRHFSDFIGRGHIFLIEVDEERVGLEVRLNVGLKNEGAIRLYERLGFVSVGQSDTHCQMRHVAEG